MKALTWIPVLVVAGCYPQPLVRHPPWTTPAQRASARIERAQSTAVRPSIQGSVLGPAGEPVSGAVVTLVQEDTLATPNTVPVARAASSLDGRFKFPEISAGSYRLSATSPSGAAVFQPGVLVDAHADFTNINLHLGAEGVFIRGTLLDGKGQPSAYAWIQISRERQPQDVAFIETDAHGAYNVLVEAGDYFLVASLPGHEREQRLVHAIDSQDVDLSLQFSPVTTPPSPEVISWLKDNVIPLSTDPDRAVADLDRLGKVLEKSRVVLLGESTSGAHELWALKHRMLAFLRTNLDFDLLAIDADFGESLALNDFLVRGTGDPIKLLRGMHDWRWDNAEALSLIRWIRAYNVDKSHRRKLKLAGVDVRRPAASTRALLDFFHRVDSAYWKKVEPTTTDGLPGPLLAEMNIRLAVQKIKYIKKSSRDAWMLACHHGRVLTQWTALTQEPQPGATREQFMAENAQWLLDREGPQGRMVIWSDNNHIRVTAPDDAAKPIGQYLREAYGDSLYAFGVTFGQGAFQAPRSSPAAEEGGELTVQTAAPMPVGTLEATLDAAEVPMFALDFQSLPREGDVREFFYQRRSARSIGPSGTGESFVAPTTPVQMYDGVLFVDTVTAFQP